MFDYYRFRYSKFKEWQPELGYELAGPAGVFGVLLVLYTLYLTSPHFGFFMWKASMPLPAIVALALTVLMTFLAYVTDDLKRSGLWLLWAVCAVSMTAVIPLTYLLHQHYLEIGTVRGFPPPSAIAVGCGFAVYLGIIAWLTWQRLRA